MSAASKLSKLTELIHGKLPPELSKSVRLVDEAEGGASGADLTRAIVAVEDFSPVEVVNFAVDHHAQQICQANGAELDAELNTSAVMLTDPQKFLDFPIATIFKPHDVSSANEAKLAQFSATFQRANEKGLIISRLREHLINQGRAESLVNDACLVADEMFTNAVYNAPFTDLKTHHNPGVDRSDPSVKMTRGRSAKLFLGHDENRLVVGCSDPFGSLDVEPLLARIRDCCVKGVSDTMRLGAGGAGIGSYLVFNIGSAYYVGVSHGRATVVCCVIHWKWSSRRRTEALKNLHWFQF